jgi:hypothetical protein
VFFYNALLRPPWNLIKYANSQNASASCQYSISSPLMYPFMNIHESWRVHM